MENSKSKEDMTGNAVVLKDVTVSFRSYHQQPTTLKEYLISFAKRGALRYHSTFDALKSVNLEIPQGKVFGIIGSNGAGKSTLLSVIAQVIKPQTGEVVVNGDLDSLRSLGAGFDAELNAIENIYLYQSLKGFSKKQIKERVDHILDFAELQDFAYMPIKYYSSGMFARLGFAVAIDSSPDILVVDEVLAVGDSRFHDKCHKVFDNLIENNKTLIMVSHDIEYLKSKADTMALLSKGTVEFVGDPEETVEKYNQAKYETALTATE